ncbi:carbohydrate ABC transporter permease [Rugosimonospora africana]|uniref:Sugar ABC transporter permease n=1 Tax=Rugosimonospora africana TaxID=556532 RepID=A0A8J3QVH8_9ACTN|nr:sugar ABC transporter permease [Rugosimonospora africana]GIH17839.1 sugar ABC transporter permease [Rugosimonospora africana]
MRWRTAVYFLVPAFLLYTLFVVYPLLSALADSFWRWEGTARGGFAGLANFTGLFTTFPLNHQLWPAFWHTVVFFIGTMVVQNTFGLLVAVVLTELRFGRRFFQTVYTLPYLVGGLVVGYLWSLLLSPSFGPVNAALRAVGLGSFAKPWLGDPSTALPVVILVNAWQYVGFPILLFGAALAGLPSEYAEASRVDGANAWQRFFRVTLPLLLPSIGVVSILTFIGCFNTFELVYSLEGAQGNQPTGPGGATDVLGLIFYRVAFQEGGADAIGQSSALAVLLFLFIFGIAVLANRIVRRREAELT